MLRLAHDPAVMVCEPVIRFSPMLTQEDLVTLIATGPPPSTLMAVAQAAKRSAPRCRTRSSVPPIPRRSVRCWPTRPRRSAKPRWIRWPPSPRNRPTGKRRWSTGRICRRGRSACWPRSSPAICWRPWPLGATSIPRSRNIYVRPLNGRPRDGGGPVRLRCLRWTKSLHWRRLGHRR